MNNSIKTTILLILYMTASAAPIFGQLQKKSVYFENGILNYTYYVDSRGLRQGSFKLYNSEGKIVVDFNLKNNLYHGKQVIYKRDCPMTEFDPDHGYYFKRELTIFNFLPTSGWNENYEYAGYQYSPEKNPVYVCTCANGYLDGWSYEYNSDGSVSCKTLYDNGELIESIFYEYWPNKKLKKETTNEIVKEWYENGQLKSEGGSKEWYSNGQLKRDGKKQYYENGQVKTDGISEWYINGQLKSDGKGMVWFENGQLQTDGKKEWYPNGQMKSDGEGRTWFEDGKREFDVKYSDSAIVKGDSMFANENFFEALAQYNEALKYNPANHTVIQIKIDKTKRILDVLYQRRTTTFSYKETNPAEFDLLRNSLSFEMNSLTRNHKSGIADFQFTVSYDTLGKNLSFYKINSSSIDSFSNNLLSIRNAAFLKPSVLEGYYIASQESVALNLKWQTNRIACKSSARGLKPSVNNMNCGSTISNFINTQNYTYGKFVFDVKEKQLNEASYTDVSLVKYNTGGVAWSCLYSVLMPGMGSVKLSGGKKGWGRFACFIVSGGVAAGLKLYSNQQYNKYLSATDQASMNKYYNSSNKANHWFWISGGVAASIYLWDIAWVVTKSIKILKESKPLKDKIRTQPISIQNQEISIK